MLVIEHNLDVIKTADRLIELGPEGGEKGGTLVGEGPPEAIVADPSSYTGQYLKPLLAARASAPAPISKTRVKAAKKATRAK